MIAERVRKLGASTIKSVGHVKRLQRVLDNDADYVTPHDMLAELRDDNKELLKHMRILHEVCDEHGDIATASLIENWVDETEQRVWFLFETGRHTEGWCWGGARRPVGGGEGERRRWRAPARTRRFTAGPSCFSARAPTCCMAARVSCCRGRARARPRPGRRRRAPRGRGGRCTRRARRAPAP